MEAHIDAEIARLEAHRSTLDLESFARERAEAPERAMFDAGRDAALARRYEAAATRTLFRALKEFEAIEGRAGGAVDPEGPSALDEPTPGVGEVLDHGDAVEVVDPTDRAEVPPPRPREPRPLGSFGITVGEASRVLSQPHFSRPPVPFDQPLPPIAPAPGARR